jgi:mono/diheme cytochrome c family protein
MAAIAVASVVIESVQPSVNAATQVASPGAENTQHALPHPAVDPGAAVYARNCAICHGDQREGILPAFPPLMGIQRRMTSDKIVALVHTGKGRMPGFPKLEDGELEALVHYLTTAEPMPAAAQTASAGGAHSSGLAAAGEALFHQNCAFCHGRDAMGGESGPDLTQSKIVLSDTNGDKIATVVREGRPDNKMPAFNFSSEELHSLVAFIHARVEDAALHKGGRRGVEVADLQTGNVAAGELYFKGAGGCVKCHSASGDLAGIASRYQGLRLEERMLYPRDAKSTVTVTLPSGQKLTGTLAYRDEFTIGLRDSSGFYHSWAADRIHFVVNSPVEAHVELFGKYTDDDIHNLMAYLQTLH